MGYLLDGEAFPAKKEPVNGLSYKKPCYRVGVQARSSGHPLRNEEEKAANSKMLFLYQSLEQLTGGLIGWDEVPLGLSEYLNDESSSILLCADLGLMLQWDF